MSAGFCCRLSWERRFELSVFAKSLVLQNRWAVENCLPGLRHHHRWIIGTRDKLWRINVCLGDPRGREHPFTLPRINFVAQKKFLECAGWRAGSALCHDYLRLKTGTVFTARRTHLIPHPARKPLDLTVARKSSLQQPGGYIQYHPAADGPRTLPGCGGVTTHGIGKLCRQTLAVRITRRLVGCHFYLQPLRRIGCFSS